MIKTQLIIRNIFKNLFFNQFGLLLVFQNLNIKLSLLKIFLKWY